LIGHAKPKRRGKAALADLRAGGGAIGDGAIKAFPTSRPGARLQAKTESPIIKISPPERGAPGVQAARDVVRIRVANRRIKPPAHSGQDAVAWAEVNQDALNPPARQRMLGSKTGGDA